ncbi:MAG: sugar transferase [Clostridia bacterium]|nr:sugar transferase [Clostridia bacterium]
MYRKIVKPTLDFLFALLLILLLWPLMGIVALITWIDLGLPLRNLLREREGKNKKTYIMYKFRTKALDSDGHTFSNTYTKVSRFIDKTRLNELPQLFNILFGQMSFVGPRPFIPGESDKFKDIIDPKRYMMRPGVTGLAQINGGRSISTKTKLKYDVEYYDNMSFWLDLKIVFITIGELLTFDVDKANKKRAEEINARKK